MDINLTLNVQEVNAVLSVLGEIPAKMGLWPLIVKIKEQADAQIPQENKEEQ